MQDIRQTMTLPERQITSTCNLSGVLGNLKIVNSDDVAASLGGFSLLSSWIMFLESGFWYFNN